MHMLVRIRSRHFEVNAAVVILFCGGGQIQIGKCNPAITSRRQIVQRASHNCVVLDFGLASIPSVLPAEST